MAALYRKPHCNEGRYNEVELYTKMVGSAHFVKSTPPRAFSISF